jgi:hypothetical protein
MRTAWSFVRCRILGRHRRQPVLEPDENGWRCDEVVLERSYVERVHDTQLQGAPLSTGAAGGPPVPAP